jgi:hypothetical protein
LSHLSSKEEEEERFFIILATDYLTKPYPIIPG